MFDATDGGRIADRQTCVIFDGRTGRVAHVHESVTLEGAPSPSREEVEARAMELARDFAPQLPWVELEHLELLHVPQEELPDGPVYEVDLSTRKIVGGRAVPPSLD